MKNNKKQNRLRCQKEEYSLSEEKHYLNCAFMSPLSKEVEQAGIMGVKRKSQPYNITATDFFEESFEIRGLFAKIINAQASDIALIPAVSYGMATIAKNINIKAGQNIVLLHEQFPSNVYAWMNFQEQGVLIKTIKQTDSKSDFNEQILAAIDENTALVTLPQVHWADGYLFDLINIGKKARQHGAAFVIDGSQSVGSLAFDVRKIKPDALIVAGYKTLMGPYGLGYMYLGERFINGKPLEENWIGRKDSEDFAGLVDYKNEYAEGAVRFDLGERSNPILLPMGIAALRQVLERGVDNIQQYCSDLIAPYLTRITALGYKLDSHNTASHIFGMRMPANIKLQDLQLALKKHNVFVSIRGDAIRVSINVYNDKSDLEALLAALEEALS